MIKTIQHKTGKAIHDFNLINEGDNILVALSGGKDSYILLDILVRLRKKAPVSFSLTGITIDAGFGGLQTEPIASFCQNLGVPYIVHQANISSTMADKHKEGTSVCSFCARLRRGSLYAYANKHGFNKIALGHHADDLIETLLMNQFFSGSLKSMAAYHVTDDKRNIVIRPLVYVFEREIAAYQEQRQFPVQPSQCPHSYRAEDSKRLYIKQLLNRLEEDNPRIRANLLHSLTNVVGSHLLCRPAG